MCVVWVWRGVMCVCVCVCGQDAEMSLETERRNMQESSDALTVAERKLLTLQSELADLQAQLAAVRCSHCHVTSA